MNIPDWSSKNYYLRLWHWDYGNGWPNQESTS